MSEKLYGVQLTPLFPDASSEELWVVFGPGVIVSYGMQTRTRYPEPDPDYPDAINKVPLVRENRRGTVIVHGGNVVYVEEHPSEILNKARINMV